MIVDIYLYAPEPNPHDIVLSDPTESRLVIPPPVVPSLIFGGGAAPMFYDEPRRRKIIELEPTDDDVEILAIVAYHFIKD